MGHRLKFNGDSKSVSLIIIVLDPAEIGCYLFWLIIHDRSNNKSCHEYRCHTFRVGIVSRLVLDRIYRFRSTPTGFCYVIVISVPRTTRSLRNGTALHNIALMHKEKTVEDKFKDTVRFEKWVDSGTESDKCKESALSAFKKGVTCPLFLVVCPHTKLQNPLITSMETTLKDPIIVSLFHLVIMSIW